MASIILDSIASLTAYLSTNLVHPVLYPFPWIPTLHAARISLAYRGRIAATGNSGRLGRGPELAGFLLMCWGGSLATHYLVSVPPPQILSAAPSVNYLSAHLLIGLLISTLGAPSAKALDTFLPLLDAILRTGAITSSISLIRAHPNPAVSSSLFLQLLVGAISSAGGGVLATTLSVWEPVWTLRTPPVLNANWVGSLDVWSGSVAAVVYGYLAGTHEEYGRLRSYLGGVEGSEKGTAGPLMTPLGARSAAIVVLTTLYAYRTYATHYTGVVAYVAPQESDQIKEKEQ